jgi:hypothetical protein
MMGLIVMVVFGFVIVRTLWQMLRLPMRLGLPDRDRGIRDAGQDRHRIRARRRETSGAQVAVEQIGADERAPRGLRRDGHDPENGSSTRSPGCEYRSTARRANASGNCAGCSPNARSGWLCRTDGMCQTFDGHAPSGEPESWPLRSPLYARLPGCFCGVRAAPGLKIGVSPFEKIRAVS